MSGNREHGKSAQADDQNPDVALAGSTGDDGVHRLTARIYFADTDFSGAVYHGRYLEFLERGRSDFLRSAGVYHTDLRAGSEGEPLFWVVRRMELDFRAPASIDDVITVETAIVELGGARIRMAQQIKRQDIVLIDAVVTAALINGDGRPRRFPKHWISQFGSIGEHQS